MNEYAFDVTLVASLRVKAPDEATARDMLREHIDSNTANLGAWPDGAPILAEVSLNWPDPAHLYEVNGEAPEDGTPVSGRAPEDCIPDGVTETHDLGGLVWAREGLAPPVETSKLLEGVIQLARSEFPDANVGDGVWVEGTYGNIEIPKTRGLVVAADELSVTIQIKEKIG